MSIFVPISFALNELVECVTLKSSFGTDCFRAFSAKVILSLGLSMNYQRAVLLHSSPLQDCRHEQCCFVLLYFKSVRWYRKSELMTDWPGFVNRKWNRTFEECWWRITLMFNSDIFIFFHILTCSPLKLPKIPFKASRAIFLSVSGDKEPKLPETGSQWDEIYFWNASHI